MISLILTELVSGYISLILGPNGRVIAADVNEFSPSAPVPGKETKAASKQQKSSAPAVEDYTDIPVTNIRGVIASRLTSSKQNIPHYYLTSEVNLEKVIAYIIQ